VPGTPPPRLFGAGRARPPVDEVPALHQPLLPSAPYEVREVVARSVLQRCNHPHIPWSVNPYQGCSHGCTFCYVPSLLHVERSRWGRYVLVKRNAPTVLAKELRAHARSKALVAMSTATDPYQAVEARCLVTRRCLEVLAKADWPLSVLTRSPLVLRDLDLLQRFSEVEVGMSLPTLDDHARRFLEPGAPSIEARLRCLRALGDAGLRTFVSLAPCYPLTGGTTAQGFARTLAQAGVRKVWVGAYRHYGDSWAHVLPAARASGIPGLERMADAPHMRGVVAALLQALEEEGIGDGGAGEVPSRPGDGFGRAAA
jgi:DNA repair photolyase